MWARGLQTPGASGGAQGFVVDRLQPGSWALCRSTLILCVQLRPPQSTDSVRSRHLEKGASPGTSSTCRSTASVTVVCSVLPDGVSGACLNHENSTCRPTLRPAAPDLRRAAPRHDVGAHEVREQLAPRQPGDGGAADHQRRHQGARADTHPVVSTAAAAGRGDARQPRIALRRADRRGAPGVGRRLREDDGRRFPRERARPWRHAVVRQAPPAPGRSARAGSNRPTRLARAGDAGARWRDRIRHGRHQARRDADAAVRFTAGRGSLRRSEQSRPHRRSLSRRSLGPVPDSGAARQPESVRRARRRIRRALQHLGRRLGRRRLPGHQDDPELPAASRPGRRLRRGADGLRRDRRAGTAHAHRAADAKRVVRRGRRGPVADCGAVDFAAGQAAGAVGPHPADGPFRSAAAAGRAVRGPRARTCVQPHGEPPR